MSYRLLAPFYDWVAPWFSRYRSPRLLTSRVLDIAPDPCDLLDVGVGTGLSIEPYVGSARFRRVVGVDPSAPMLARCRRKFPPVELHHGTLDQVGPGLGAAFDIIQSCGAVEHMLDLPGFVAHAAALLKPGGWLVFTYEPEVLFSLRQSRRAPHLGTFGREPVFRHTPREVHAAIAGAGLHAAEDLEFKAYIGLVHHLVVARPA